MFNMKLSTDELEFEIVDSAEPWVRDRMEVVSCCGRKVGVVDGVEDGTIKLTRTDSPDGHHHYVPMNWVESVDDQVHLNKDAVAVELGWQPDAASCASCC